MWYWRANRLYTWGGRQTDVCTCLSCSSTWSDNILLRTVHTDVVVISTTMALKFDCERLWLAFATGNTFPYIDATATMALWTCRNHLVAINVQLCLFFMPSQAVMWHLHLVGEESVRAGLHGKILHLLSVSWLIQCKYNEWLCQRLVKHAVQ